MVKSNPVIEVLHTQEPIEDRYTRLRQLGWDRELLKNAYALVVGAGALGNEVLKNLALLGWGNIIVVDMDTIEDSNLARSVLFRKEDVGTENHKAVIAARSVKEMNSDINIIPIVGRVQDSIGLGFFRYVDVVFGCLDNRQTRLDVSSACWQTMTPYIDGGLDGINGDVHVFLPPITACYGCTISPVERQRLSERHACLKVRVDNTTPIIPTAPTISSIIAGWQTQIAVKHLHGKKIPAGQRLTFFGVSDMVENFTVTQDSRCLEHSENSIIYDNEVVEIPLNHNQTSLKELFDYIKNKFSIESWVIGLGFELLISGKCPKCNYKKDFFKQLTSVNFNEIICPDCDSTFVLDTIQDFNGDEPFINRVLSELAIPPLHIFSVTNWEQRIYKSVQIGNQFDVFFAKRTLANPKLLSLQLSLSDEEEKTVFLPKRIQLGLLIDWLAKTGELPASSRNLEIRNQTQNFNYNMKESLASSRTQPNDKLFIRLKEEKTSENIQEFDITLEI
jgi:molybdopterin/thiamine biosynthesis adenylyltransferase